MSTSLRSQRLAIYAYTDASSNGVPAASYAYSATRWGRVTETMGRAIAVGAEMESQANATIAFSSEVTLGENDLVVAPDGTIYRVLRILPRPAAHEIEVLAVTADDASYTLTGTPSP